MHQMHITNEVSPSDPDQLAQLGEPGPDGPIYMVNLLKFKERAGYEDGRETDLTGAEAEDARHGRPPAPRPTACTAPGWCRWSPSTAAGSCSPAP